MATTGFANTQCGRPRSGSTTSSSQGGCSSRVRRPAQCAQQSATGIMDWRYLSLHFKAYSETDDPNQDIDHAAKEYKVGMCLQLWEKYTADKSCTFGYHELSSDWPDRAYPQNLQRVIFFPHQQTACSITACIYGNLHSLMQLQVHSRVNQLCMSVSTMRSCPDEPELVGQTPVFLDHWCHDPGSDLGGTSLILAQY
ncbi:hypothetical protein WJX79_010698 [Trebouxia sp. C0005]